MRKDKRTMTSDLSGKQPVMLTMSTIHNMVIAEVGERGPNSVHLGYQIKSTGIYQKQKFW